MYMTIRPESPPRKRLGAWLRIFVSAVCVLYNTAAERRHITFASSLTVSWKRLQTHLFTNAVVPFASQCNAPIARALIISETYVVFYLFIPPNFSSTVLSALQVVGMFFYNYITKTQLNVPASPGWWRGSVVRTSVFDWRTFPDMRLIYG